MAADVTLLSWPDTAEGWDVARKRTWLDVFDDDEVMRGPDGEVAAMCSGDQRDQFDRRFYEDWEGVWSWFEVGPWSPMKSGLLGTRRYLPAPTVAVHDRFVRPRVLTVADVAATTVLLNLPDTSHYASRQWTGVKGRRFAGRQPKARPLKRWLTGQVGRIVWAESW